MANRTKKPKSEAAGKVSRAVLYARVSSKEQEKEGYSIPAQLKLLKDYAAAEGFAIAQEYMKKKQPEQKDGLDGSGIWHVCYQALIGEARRSA